MIYDLRFCVRFWVRLCLWSCFLLWFCLRFLWLWGYINIYIPRYVKTIFICVKLFLYYIVICAMLRLLVYFNVSCPTLPYYRKDDEIISGIYFFWEMSALRIRNSIHATIRFPSPLIESIIKKQLCASYKTTLTAEPYRILTKADMRLG